MAKYNKIKKINEILEGFGNDNINQPIKQNAVGEYKRTLELLETVRREIITERSENIKNVEEIYHNVANLTHDLKTPLQVISGYAECIQDGIKDKDYPMLIMQKTTEMNEKVLDIINGAKLSENKNKAEKMIVNTKEFFVFLDTKKQEKSGVRICIGKVPNVRLYISENDIRKTIENIISNAEKYCNKKPKIKISFTAIFNHLTIKIKDNGNGINKNDIPYVFDRFFMGDKSRASGGSGVGLSFAKETINSHGGRIWVKSKEGKGSVFYIMLPIYNNKVRYEYSQNEKSLLSSLANVFLFPFKYIYDCVNIFYRIYLISKYGRNGKKNG